VFDAHDVTMAHYSLMAYAVGLQAFILIKVLAPGYYAFQDTRTPVRYGVIAMGVNMVLNLLLIFPLQHAGLALATSLSAYLNAFLLLRGLKGQDHYRPLAGWPRLLLQVGAAAVGMVALLAVFSPGLDWWVSANRLDRVLHLAGLILAAAAVYFLVLGLAGVRPRQLKAGGEA
jgi:putative peptidoglycan lipid II flippase